MNAPSFHYQLIEQEYSALFREFKSFAPHAGVVFKVLGVLGEGGMGKVLKVRDERLGRLAALKLLVSKKQSEQSKELFVRESQIMSWLDHPSIPPVYEWGCTAEGEHYLLMRLVDGATLSEKIEECHNKGTVSKADRRTLLENLVKVTEAVAYAHSMGFLHRDLKPDNIMVGPFGEVLLMDWGLAKDMQGRLKNIEGKVLEAANEGKLNSGLNEKSKMVGTVGYMSPEQANSEKTDQQSDVFALGVILTRLLSNQDAIHGENSQQMLFATVAGRIKGPRQLLKGVPRELDSLAVKAMALRKEDRIQSAEAFGEELKAYLAGQKLSVHNYSLVERLSLWIRNHVTLAFVALLLILLISLSGFLRAWIEQSKVEAQKSLSAAEEKTREKALALEKEKNDLIVAEQEKGFAKRAANRAKKVLDLFNQAKELGRRELKKKKVQGLVEEAVELAGRNETALMTAADVYDKAGLIEPLKRVLEEVVEKHPRALAALYYLHWIEVRNDSLSKERYWRETPYLKRFIEESNKVGDVNEYTLMAKALEFEKAGKYKEALRVYDRIEGMNSQFLTVFYARGTLYGEQLKDMKKAISDFTRAIEMSPNFLRAYWSRGLCFYYLEQFEKSLADFEYMLSIDAKNATALYWKSLMLTRLGRNSKALSNAELGVRLYPEDFQQHLKLSQAYVGLKKWKKALECCQKANELKPNNAEVYQDLGIVYDGLGQLDKAMEAWQKSVDLNPDWYASRYSRALGFYKKGMFQFALKDCNQSLKLNGNQAFAFRLRGLIYMKLGAEKEAFDNLNAALKLRSEFAEPYLDRAGIHLVMKHYKLSLSDCEIFKRLSPK
ncbi:MAG: tetratricopeptide repeat protein, partial [Planctomycetota bacterium]|nr:tetratricopeptide repeat protein [Planctomycetota bacterium]